MKTNKYIILAISLMTLSLSACRSMLDQQPYGQFIEAQMDENEKDRIRWEVLDFANSCRNGRKHTKDEYQHIITLHDKYKRLLEKTNDTNGVFDEEYAYIKRLYAERQEKNDFL